MPSRGTRDTWHPRLAHGSQAERAHWRLIGEGEGLHWPELDEAISVEGLLAGRRSGETQASLRRWFERRKTGRHPTGAPSQHARPRTPRPGRAARGRRLPAGCARLADLLEGAELSEIPHEVPAPVAAADDGHGGVRPGRGWHAAGCGCHGHLRVGIPCRHPSGARCLGRAGKRAGAP